LCLTTLNGFCTNMTDPLLNIFDFDSKIHIFEKIFNVMFETCVIYFECTESSSIHNLIDIILTFVGTQMRIRTSIFFIYYVELILKQILYLQPGYHLSVKKKLRLITNCISHKNL